MRIDATTVSAPLPVRKNGKTRRNGAARA